MADVSAVTNLIPNAKEGFTTTLASTVASGAATVPLNSVTGYNNGDIAVLVVEPSDPTKKQAVTGTVDTAGVQLTGAKWTEGTNQQHLTGVTVVDYVTATHQAMFRKAWLTEHTLTGTHGAITATSISDNGTSLSSVRSETFFDHVASGLAWGGDAYGSTRAASMGAGVVYIGGKRLVVAAVTARTFAASSDTYVDIDNTGTPVYTVVANNAASPSLAANSLRIAIVVTGATNILNSNSINQGQEFIALPIASSVPYQITDSLGNLICPRDSQRRILGYRMVTANQATSSGTYVDITGLSMTVNVPANRKVTVKAFLGDLQQAASGTGQFVNIVDVTNSNTQIAESGAVGVGYTTVIPEVSYTPGASGARTYKAQFKSDGTRTINTNGGATTPIWLRVCLDAN